MTYTALLPTGDDRGPVPGMAFGPPALPGTSAASIGLWVFLGVASSLFSLFTLAFALRMNGSDWTSIALPWQLWLSTGVLALGSLVLHRAARAARTDDPKAVVLLRAGGLCAAIFLVVQFWAWTALLGAQVGFTGNPAASFFYLLTAMHGLHVAGGLVGWALAMRALRKGSTSARRGAPAVALCARYWHFLLAVWVVLFGALGWLSPEFVRYVCGTG